MSQTPSEYFNKSVKGTLITAELPVTMNDKKHVYESDEYEFIDILEQNGKKIYVTNQWYKEYKNEPLYIIEDLVKSVSLK